MVDYSPEVIMNYIYTHITGTIPGGQAPPHPPAASSFVGPPNFIKWDEPPFACARIHVVSYLTVTRTPTLSEILYPPLNFYISGYAKNHMLSVTSPKRIYLDVYPTTLYI